MAKCDESAFHARRAAECVAMARAAGAPEIAAIHDRLRRLHAEAQAQADSPPELHGVNDAWWWPARQAPGWLPARAERLAETC